jgi:RimJ/RimL family protein N-acetyltransferase
VTPLVRTASVGDLPAVAALYEGLPDIDRYRRFFTGSRSAPAWELRRLAEELPHAPVAVVAVAGEVVAGVATYGIHPETSDAELGIVVAPRWRRQGVASALIAELAALAAAAGITRLAWTIQADNLPARELMGRLHPAPQRSIGGGLVAGSCAPGAIARAA